MSEHMSINGEVNYWHLPYDEEGAFTYCNHCKKTCDRITIDLNEGIVSDWICLRCSKCKKSIWTGEIKRKQTKDDKKCEICKKPTNWIDCYCHSWFGLCKKDKERFVCSKKCSDKLDKIDNKLRQTHDENNNGGDK